MPPKAPIIDPNGLKAMLTTSSGTLRQIADKLECTVWDLVREAHQHGVPLPKQSDEQYRYGEESPRAPKPRVNAQPDNLYDWLIYDDLNRATINGLQLNRMIVDAKGNLPIDINAICEYFHGSPLKCIMTGKELTTENSVFKFLDGNKSNFLITNIEPLHADAYEATYGPLNQDNDLLTMTTSRHYTFHAATVTRAGRLTGHAYDLKLTFLRPLLRRTGSVLDVDSMDKLIDRWVVDYLHETALTDLFPPNTTPTLEIVSWWAWKQLSNVALIKGLRSIELSDGKSTTMLLFSTILNLMGKKLQENNKPSIVT